MSQFTRIVAGLLFVNALCVVVVLSLFYSDTAWGCIRYEAFPLPALLDVSHKARFVESTALSAYSFTENYSWLPDSDKLLYHTQPTPTTSRLTLVSQSRILGYVDSEDTAEHSTQFNGNSPKRQYMVFNTRDLVLGTKTITIRDLNTLAPIVSTTVRSTEPLGIPRYALDDVNTGWSPTERWFGFSSQVPSATLMNFVDVLTKTSQTISIEHRDSPFIIWSATETALAVVSIESSPHLDIITLQDGRWRRVNTTDLSIQGGEDIYQKSRQVLDVRWTADGTALVVTLRDSSTSEASRHTLKVFHLVNQKIDHVSTPIRNVAAEPKIMLGGTWACVSSDVPQYDDLYAAGTGNLISLTSPGVAIELVTNCQTVLQASTPTAMLVKQKSADQPDGQWSLITSDPMTMLLPHSPKLAFYHWSDDGKFIFFSNRQHLTHGLMDTTTWLPYYLPQPAYTSRYSYSPDSTRLTVLSDDRRHIWLYDRQGHLLAALPLPKFERFDFTLLWSPDNQKFLLTNFTFDVQLMIYDRDGQPLATFDRREIPYGYPTFNAPNLGWTHCEPSPKFPRMNLPQ